VSTPLTITTSSLSAGYAGAYYSQQAASASGGSGPYTWSISSGSPPSGLVLDPSGPANNILTIDGYTASTGPFSFTLRVTDSSNQTATAGSSSTLTINAATLFDFTGDSTGFDAVWYLGRNTTNPACNPATDSYGCVIRQAGTLPPDGGGLYLATSQVYLNYMYSGLQWYTDNSGCPALNGAYAIPTSVSSETSTCPYLILYVPPYTLPAGAAQGYTLVAHAASQAPGSVFSWDHIWFTANGAESNLLRAYSNAPVSSSATGPQLPDDNHNLCSDKNAETGFNVVVLYEFQGLLGETLVPIEVHEDLSNRVATPSVISGWSPISQSGWYSTQETEDAQFSGTNHSLWTWIAGTNQMPDNYAACNDGTLSPPANPTYQDGAAPTLMFTMTQHLFVGYLATQQEAFGTNDFNGVCVTAQRLNLYQDRGTFDLTHTGLDAATNYCPAVIVN